VAELTPSQAQTRERVESLIRLIAPALDVLLLVGDRVSRIVEPEDFDYYPVRPVTEPGDFAMGAGGAISAAAPSDQA
jgi:hypothetical protein